MTVSRLEEEENDLSGATPADPLLSARELTGDLSGPFDVYLVCFLLSGSASSHQSWLMDRFLWMQRKLGLPSFFWASHQALRIHGNYYELVRDQPYQLPFTRKAKFKFVYTTDPVCQQIQRRPRWIKEDIFLGTTMLTPQDIFEIG